MAEDLVQRYLERIKAIEDAEVQLYVPEEDEPRPTKNEYMRDAYHDGRMKLLDEFVPDRKCPMCGVIHLKSRQWVVIARVDLLGVTDLPDAMRRGRGAACCITCRRGPLLESVVITRRLRA